MSLNCSDSDIAYAIKSIRTTGGCIDDADIIEAVLEEDGKQYLPLIEMDLATVEVADDLKKMIWQRSLR